MLEKGGQKEVDDMAAAETSLVKSFLKLPTSTVESSFHDLFDRTLVRLNSPLYFHTFPSSYLSTLKNE